MGYDSKHDEEEDKTDPIINHENLNIKGRIDKRKQSYMSKKEAKLTVDENKEKINVDYMVYYNFFTYSNWIIVTMIFSVILIILNRFVMMLFSYYMLNWVKDISANSSNNSSLLMDVIYTT